MDKRKNYYLIVDVETAGPFENMFVYDIGAAIIDKKGYVYEQVSYVIKEIYQDSPEIMAQAFYWNKMGYYQEALKNGEAELVTYVTAWNALRGMIKRWNVKNVVAHNARFDISMLDKTLYYVTQKYRYFFPKNINYLCTMQMANATVAKQKSYISWAKENGYMTKHKTPRPRVTAEILYRYMTGIEDYEENHTGLEDVLIEKEIFAWIMRQKKKTKKLDYYKKIE